MISEADINSIGRSVQILITGTVVNTNTLIGTRCTWKVCNMVHRQTEEDIDMRCRRRAVAPIKCGAYSIGRPAAPHTLGL